MKTNEKAVSIECENRLPKKKNNKVIIIGIILTAIIAFVVGLIIYNSSDNSISEQLDLGQKYLEEQDYEQAVIAFNTVIEIDDKCIEAYIGLAETYIRMGEYDKALETASKGYELTGDESLSEYIDMLESGNVSRSDGKIMKRTAYDGNGAVLFYHEFTYDKQGRQASITHYNSEHVFVSTIDFLYDENDNWLVSYLYGGGTGTLTKVDCTYENGLLVSEKWGGEDPVFATFEYDEKGRKIKEIREYETSERIDTYWLYQYDENDNRIRSEIYTKDNELLEFQTWEYQNNELYKYSIYEGNGNLRWYEIYSDDGVYKYDATGNLTGVIKED